MNNINDIINDINKIHPKPTAPFAPMAYWDEKVFDMMNYLVSKYGLCEIEYADKYNGITAVFKGKYKVSIKGDGSTEWLTNEPPDD